MHSCRLVVDLPLCLQTFRRFQSPDNVTLTSGGEGPDQLVDMLRALGVIGACKICSEYT